MKSRAKATFACLAVALAASAASGATPAAAASERMQLPCESGSLVGHTLERANGSSWWNVEDGTVYTAKSLTIGNEQGMVVFQHTYGKKSRAPETCTGTHFEWTWYLELVEAGP